MARIFKPKAIATPNYQRRITIIYALAAFVFLTGGVVAFTLDSVTLLGRTGANHFDGVDAHIAGIFSFLVTAYWISKIVRENHGGQPMLFAPYVVAVIGSIVLIAYKYG